MTTDAANRVDGEYVTVTWKLEGAHWISWVAYEIVARTLEHKPMYEIPDWHATGDETDDLSSAQPYCSGYLEGDGCNEWTFDMEGMHYCSPGGILRTVGEVVEIIRGLALQHMPSAREWLPRD